MPRSIRKGPFIASCLLKKINRHLAGEAKGVIETKKRGSMILPMMEGMTFAVHNGKEFVRVFIIMEMIGHKLGEFVPTRKPPKHSDKKS